MEDVLPHQDFSIHQFSTATLASGRRHPLPGACDRNCTLCSLGMVSPGVEYWLPCLTKDGLCLLLVFFPECLFPRRKPALCSTLASSQTADVDYRQWLLLTLDVLWSFQEQKHCSVNSSRT